MKARTSATKKEIEETPFQGNSDVAGDINFFDEQ